MGKGLHAKGARLRRGRLLQRGVARRLRLNQGEQDIELRRSRFGTERGGMQLDQVVAHIPHPPGLCAPALHTPKLRDWRIAAACVVPAHMADMAKTAASQQERLCTCNHAGASAAAEEWQSIEAGAGSHLQLSSGQVQVACGCQPAARFGHQLQQGG